MLRFEVSICAELQDVPASGSNHSSPERGSLASRLDQITDEAVSPGVVEPETAKVVPKDRMLTIRVRHFNFMRSRVSSYRPYSLLQKTTLMNLKMLLTSLWQRTSGRDTKVHHKTR